jgi:hypothetical protein
MTSSVCRRERRNASSFQTADEACGKVHMPGIAIISSTSIDAPGAW